MSDDEKVLSQADIDAMLSDKSLELPVSEENGASVATATKTRSSTEKEASSETQPVKTSAATPKNQTPAPAKKEATTLPGAEVKPFQQKAAANPGEIDALQRSLEDVIKRLEKIENAIEQMGQVEKQLAKQVTELSGTGSRGNKLQRQVEELAEQMEEISDNLRSSLGYGAAKIFQCSDCGSAGTVAIHVKCTQCGEENWMGWWPEDDE